jgi:hypothetical protein
MPTQWFELAKMMRFNPLQRGEHCIKVSHIRVDVGILEVDAHDLKIAREIGTQPCADRPIGSGYGNL